MSCSVACRQMDDDNLEIKIKVATNYLDDQSDADLGRFVFAYTITIENIGEVSAKLISRHWVITDANGKIQEVSGDTTMSTLVEPRFTTNIVHRMVPGSVGTNTVQVFSTDICGPHQTLEANFQP